MQSVICRGCCSMFENTESAKNVFIDSLLLDSNNQGREENILPEGFSTISSSLQLITGYKISKTDGLSPYLCQECTKKLAAYVTFRRQLFSAQSSLLHSQHLSIDSSNTEKKSEIEGADRSVLSKNAEEEQDMKDNCVSSKHTSNNLEIIEEQSLSNNADIDDKSICSIFSNTPKIENDANDVPRISVDQDNNRENDLEISNSSVDISIYKEYDVRKNEEYDIESDIDVCSGEDHEVLELDIPNKRNETVEIESSSESDIEVCDHDSDVFICVVKRPR